MAQNEVGTVYVNVKANLAPLIEQLEELSDILGVFFNDVIAGLEELNG